MENHSSRALLLAGVVLVAILIVGLGMYIYGQSSGSATTAYSTLSTQEINAFNSQFEIFNGTQKGTNVANLIGILIANSNSNGLDFHKIPSLKIVGITGKSIEAVTPTKSEELDDYLKNLGIAKQNVETKHKYTVELQYGNEGLISGFIISY